ncbi:C45 family peptidase [Oscillochloris sp. ZM17-4]|uniref:C45 family autoproteolytic acyltransferase/hydolase n=1 Tax=Oscillochloris sp. ZM17-4 TaxID=2866714 RepID=UPI001C7338FA|nr:C45 family peptidase [Oscillochloris sp. ZM17-4]MBX0327420.1 C45 family peptidase [Oscillochloris sp. ZM17-4]
MTLPLVRLTGTPYQQGLQHGEALRDAIAENMAIYFARFERELRLSREETLRRAAAYAEAIARQSPAYAAGMRGVAEGSGFSYAEIAALNVRYELFYYQFGVNAVADGCTAFAVLPEASADGHLIIGENWDWVAGVRGAVLHSREPDGLEVLCFSEAGIVGGKIGLNAAGVGLLINGLTSTDDDWARLRKPFHVRCYEILRARSFDAATRVVTDSDRSCSGNFVVAQAPDRVINIETSPHAAALTGCASGCLVHTNHFVDPAALAVSEPPVEKSPHSYRRLERMAELLDDHRPLSMADLQAALRDHQGHPYGICFHIDPEEPPEEHYESVTSAIIDLSAGALYLSDGPPCESPYQRYTIADCRL